MGKNKTCWFFGLAVIAFVLISGCIKQENVAIKNAIQEEKKDEAIPSTPSLGFDMFIDFER